MNKRTNFGRKIKIKKIRASSKVEDMQDIIPAELFLTITLNGAAAAMISCSPQNLIELAVGYLINNGYISSYSDINLLKICHKEIDCIISKNDFFINVEVQSNVKMQSNYGQPKFISSACGSIDDFILNSGLQKIKSGLRINYRDVLKMNTENAGMQEYKKQFGGLHSAALFKGDGSLLAMAEDIGRHNCIDKIAGRISISKIDVCDKILFTTGRLSLDAVHKVIKMKIPAVVTNSSITYSAALFAKKMNLTAIGYARGGRFNIYSVPSRIITGDKM